VRLFHVSPQPLRPDFVLTAGHFGRMLESFTTKNASDDSSAPWRMASEMIVEMIRTIEFPHRPSRLNCCYAWRDETAAREFLSQAPPGYCLTAVVALNPDAKQFLADFQLMSAVTRFREDVPFLPWNVQIARHYWSGEQIQVPELLIESNLRVLEVLP
jgi:hypothetical protein